MPRVGGKLHHIWLNVALPEPVGRDVPLFDVVVLSRGSVLFRRSVRANNLRIAGSSGNGIVQTPVGCVAPNGVDHWPVHDIDLEIGRIENADEIWIEGRSAMIVFDAYADTRSEVSCPFHTDSAGVSLAELGTIVRIGDRPRYEEALSQYQASLRHTDDLDEARGLSLTLMAVIAAALLELGAPRKLHQHQLHMARQFDSLSTIEEICDLTTSEANALVSDLMPASPDATPTQIRAALEILDRRYAQFLVDSDVASEVGLSTSHFRFLFKQATGEPFQKYLLRLRLEKARTLLQDHTLTVGEVTHLVGFVSAAHFTRSFSRRFGFAPSHLK